MDFDSTLLIRQDISLTTSTPLKIGRYGECGQRTINLPVEASNFGL